MNTYLKFFIIFFEVSKSVVKNIMWYCKGTDYCRYNFTKLLYVTKPQTNISLNLYASTSNNGQTHSNNSSAVANDLFECV